MAIKNWILEPEDSWQDLSPDQKGNFQEKAGILQDSGMTPEQAEKFSWCFTVCMLTSGMAALCERVKPCPKLSN